MRSTWVKNTSYQSYSGHWSGIEQAQKIYAADVQRLHLWGHSKQRNTTAILAKSKKLFSHIQIALANLAKRKYTPFAKFWETAI